MTREQTDAKLNETLWVTENIFLSTGIRDVMKFSAKLNISFEFFPPKTSDGKTQLQHSFSQLAKYDPEFFSVTFGAGGSTRDGTLKTVKLLQSIGKNISIAPHLSCLGVKRQTILELLAIYQSLGIKQLVVLRGDLPAGDVSCTGEFNFASELVALICQNYGNFFHIDVAAYPEIHPQAINPLDDVLNLKRKCDAGANRAITQYFFNPDAYFYFLDECEKLAIDVPIIPGIMPITQYASLVRFSKLCGAEIPCWIRKRFESFSDNEADQMSFGIEVVHRLCEDLISGGAPGLHFYTLNKAQVTIELLELLGITAPNPRLQLASNVV